MVLQLLTSGIKELRLLVMSFKIISFCMKVIFFFFRFVLNVLVQGFLPYAEVELGPSKLLSFILTESYGMLT